VQLGIDLHGLPWRRGRRLRLSPERSGVLKVGSALVAIARVPSARFALGVLITGIGCAGPASAPSMAISSPSELSPMPTSSSSSSSPAAPTPIRESDHYVIDFPPYRIEVTPELGGRIIGFRLDGKNAFAEASDSPDAFGVSLWPSPQKVWNWPPPKEIDADPYEVEVSGTKLVLRSKPAPRVGLRVTKEISADPENGAAQIVYVLENTTADPVRVAPWENARVRPRGLTFFLHGGAPHASSTLKLDRAGDVTWLAHDPERYVKSEKFFADGKEGWLAHTDGELLLLFACDDVPAGSEAPGEGEIEIYVDGAGKFVEVEHQGAFREIAPGQSLRWPVTWVLRRIPPGLDAKPVGPALIEFARRALPSRHGR
jgi:hypothetical protein